MKLWRTRSVPVPTLWGWLLLLIILAVPVSSWMFWGERFLSSTDRVPADVIVVEAWIKEDAATAAVAEFNRPGSTYHYVVATGGLTGERWQTRRWHEVDIVAHELQRVGFPNTAFVPAESADVDVQRTFESALAARHALEARGIRPLGVNVVTRGAHARRSQLVFSKAFGPGTPVGIICWKPPGYEQQRWWQSSERAVEFMKETLGWVYEATLSSGRWFSHQRAGSDATAEQRASS